MTRARPRSNPTGGRALVSYPAPHAPGTSCRSYGACGYCRGSGLPVVASITLRSPSGCCSVTDEDISSASMMQA